MKNRFMLSNAPMFAFLAMFTILMACNPSSLEEPLFTEQAEGEGNIKASATGRYEHEYEMTFDPATGEVPSHRLIRAMAYADELRANRGAGLPLQWEERGPNDVGGRTRALLIDAADPSHHTVWAGGVAGGLWKTSDITAPAPSWQKIDDFFDNLAICALAQDPINPDIMYFGTGEGWSSFDVVRGLGIWKSEDGGITWNVLPSTYGLSEYRYVNDLVVDGFSHVYVAMRNGGIRRSIDGGSNWSQVVGSAVGLGGSNQGTDLEIGPDGDLYACLGHNQVGSIWKSDAGTYGPNVGAATNWSEILPNGLTATDIRRIELAVAPGNPDILYALCQKQGFNTVGYFFQSTDGGATWAPKSLAAWGDQVWYNMILAVDPNNANRVFAGATPTFVSDDGGATWGQTFPPHVDQHSFLFLPGSSTEMILGNDGGVHYTANANSVTSNLIGYSSKNNGYNVTQFYSCALHPGFGSEVMLGGTQDNGSQLLETPGIGAGDEVTNGDGAFCFVEEGEPKYIYTSSQFGTFYRSSNGGESFGFGANNNSNRFICPADLDDEANIIYTAHNVGQYWRWSDAHTSNSGEIVVVPEIGNGATITALKVSPTVPNRLYLGLGNGKILRIDDAHTGNNKSSVIVKTQSNTVISCIEFEPGSEDHMLVTYSQYGVNSVFETKNATDPSPVWQSVEGNLPDMPVRWAIFAPGNPDQALLATELGVWTTDNLDGGSTIWQPSNNGLANVRTDMLKTRSSDQMVIAGTHGRGMFSSAYFVPLAVSFLENSAVQAEAGTSGVANGCQSFVEVEIPVRISYHASEDVEVNLSVNAASTALGNRDYILGNTQVIFSNSGPKDQSFIVKVVDDAILDGDKMLELDLSIGNPSSGATVRHFTKFHLNILDDDKDPLPSAGPQVITVGEGTQTMNIPFFGAWEDNRSEFLVLASELQAMGYGAGVLSSLSFNVVNQFSNAPYHGFTVKIGHTLDTAADGNFEPGLTQVFQADYSPVLGWNKFDFPAPFFWDGVSNLAVQTCFDNNSFMSVDLVASSNSGFFPTEYYVNSFGSGCSGFFASTTTNTRPNLRFDYEEEGSVANTLGDERNAYLGNGETAHFYNPDGQVIASIKQLNGADIGCVSVTIDRAGNGTNTPAWLNAPVSDKTFLVEADNNANYEITLFFTANELAGFGVDPTTLNLLKSTGPIGLADNANSSVYDNNGLTTGTFGSQGNVYYKSTFSSFSGFAMTSAPATALPVELVDFYGRTEESGHRLFWETASETNNKMFSLERSADGATFKAIAEIPGLGQSTTPGHYQHLDKNPFQGLSHYRLRQRDFDGKENLSAIVVLTFFGEGQLSVFPNPVKQDYLMVNFHTKEDGQLELILYNCSGKALTQKEYLISPGSNRMNVPLDDLPPGIYFLKTKAGNEINIAKIVRI